MLIRGKCHCGNIRYTLDWPAQERDIKARACSCSFCAKHGGRWTSHPESKLVATLGDAALASKYRFGTRTADFYVCTRCGAVPVVTSAIDGALYAVVNVNTFEGVRGTLWSDKASFDGEGTGERLGRRKRSWIRDVQISSS